MSGEFRRVAVTVADETFEPHDRVEQVEVLCRAALGTVLVRADTDPEKNAGQDSEMVRVMLPGGENEVILYMHRSSSADRHYLVVEVDGEEMGVKFVRNDVDVYAEGPARG